MDLACSSEAAEDIIGDCMDECMEDGEDEEMPCDDFLTIIATKCANDCASGDICENAIMEELEECFTCPKEVFAVAPAGVAITSDTEGNLRSITNQVLKMAKN